MAHKCRRSREAFSWSNSNRTIRAQREAGRADVPDMPVPAEVEVLGVCPVCEAGDVVNGECTECGAREG